MGRYVELFERLVAEREKKGYDQSPSELRPKPSEGDLCRNESGLRSYPVAGNNTNDINNLQEREGLLSLMSYVQPSGIGVKDYAKTKKHNNINSNSKIVLGPDGPTSQELRQKRPKSEKAPFGDAFQTFVNSDRNKALNHRYVQAVVDARRFLTDFGPQAEALGWRADELFGLDDAAPLARYDRMGLVWMIDGNPVVAITDIAATIRMPAGNLLKFYRRPEGQL